MVNEVMTWEQPPQRAAWVRRWRWPIVAAVVAVAVVAVGVLTRGERYGRAGPADAGELAVTRDGGTDADTGASTPARAPDMAPTPLEALDVASAAPGRAPLLPDASGMSVVVADDSRVDVIDLATGDTRKLVRRTSSASPMDVWSMSTVGNTVVTTDGPDTVRITADGRRTRLARGHWMLPTFSDDSVWVARSGAVASRDLWQLGLDGSVIGHVRVPPVAQALVGLPTGVIATAPGGLHLLTAEGSRQLVTGGQLAAVGAGGDLAWFSCGADFRCELVLGTLDDPDQHRLALARDQVPSNWYALGFGRYSPDRRWLALPMSTFDGGAPVDTAVTLIDVAAGTEVARLDQTERRAYETTGLAWTPDSRWLLSSLNEGLVAWDARSNDVKTIDRQRGGGMRSLAVLTR